MKHILRLALGATVLLAATLAVAEVVTLKGTVKATEDSDYNILSAELVLEDGTIYPIELDDNGRKIANEAYWETVEVTGTLREKEGRPWLTVQAFKRTEAPEGPAE